MTEIPKPLRVWLEKAEYIEQSPKDWFIYNNGSSEIAVDCRSDGLPTVGVLINGTIQEKETGIDDKLNDIRIKVHSFYPKNGAGNGKEKKKEAKSDPAPEKSLHDELQPPKQWNCSACHQVTDETQADETASKYLHVLCKGCEQKLNEPASKEAEVVGPDPAKFSDVPARGHNVPAKYERKELVVGTCEAVAVQYGIPTELANLFFMKMNEGLYIKNPGLLYLAGKKGYSRIEITDKYDEKSGEWTAECKIYPKLTKADLEGISKLDKEMQKQAFEFLTNPTNGTGRASKGNVRMSTMQAFLREMAQTRAQNRALRAFTGYGGTSAEELPEGQMEVS